MRKPNLFLVGALKCGTTALAQWLSEHPSVFMSTPKEPDFFYTNKKFKTLSDYNNIFAGADSRHSWVGEASVRYLTSPTAIRKVFDYSGPDAKFIVSIRNPIDMAQSLHSQRCCSLNEDILDFKTAWNAQFERKERIAQAPISIYTPEINIYGDVCRLGSQLETLINVVGIHRCLILVLDDIKNHPRSAWTSVLQFLSLPDDGRYSFPVINERKTRRSRSLAKLVKMISPYGRIVPPRLRKTFLRPIANLNNKVTRDKKIDPQFRHELVLFFNDEISKLEQLLKRDFSAWRS